MASLTTRFKGHRYQTVLNIGLLLACAFASSYLILVGAWSGAVILLLGTTILIAMRMIRQVNKQQKSFAQFIRNIAHNDFSTTTLLHGADDATADFLAAQKTLIDKYKQLKAEKSAQHEYLDRVVEHVDTALLCFDEAGKVVIANRSAKELLQVSLLINMHQIDAACLLLGEAMRSLNPGKSQLLKVVIGTETMQLLLSARDFKLLGNPHKLVSIQNIQAAIDETEIASWHKLIKVLTHEIMNSMTPIVSLSSHLEKNLQDDHDTDMGRGIRSIASRSQGLLRFVESYRSLSNLPAPVPTEINMADLFDRITLLIEDRLSSHGCTLSIDVNPPSMTIIADRHQVEQILLNLLANAVDAVIEQPSRHIRLKAYVDSRRRPVISVTDTGSGIPEKQLDDIFTPFFTTKETGSGVGLSLSRQLAQLNHAALTVRSEVGEGSSFLLVFERNRSGSSSWTICPLA
ncbi:MAG: ATP-binding protein [Pseudohongiella sp.]|uniref:PAS domain-containing sensor histidine kinase n=1 Tax=Pseudohongiella sp. TaxID=1979412 RepID=UPI00349FEC69